MFYKPKKSREIYDLKIAHRGYHKECIENTVTAYAEAIKRKMAIELDIRILKDENIVCFHDRTLKRLVGRREKIEKLAYTDIKNYVLLKSKDTIPLFRDVLKLIEGKIPILIEVKGYLNNRFLKKLQSELENYNGKIYFHTLNIFTYFVLKKYYKGKVFFVLNPFRKRFDFIKF